MPNKVKREAEGTILAPSDLARLDGVEVQNVWTPNPAQLRVLQRTEFEIFVGAGKYSGKTEMSRIWMVMGNLDRPNYDERGNPILHNISYTYHPHFLGAVIRLNEKDLAEWVDRARPYYEGVLGGTFTKNPAEFRWPSGARIFLGHAQDNNAWTKYQGQNIVRFLIEESGQIPDLETFDMIRSCCRSLYPEMRAQILLTANPGGKGQCVPDGDVLTSRGWVPISDVRIGDNAYTVLPNGELGLRRVAQTHAAHYSGPLRVIKARGLNIRCTPNHRIAKALGVRGEGRSKPFSLSTIGEMPGQATILRAPLKWTGTNPRFFRVPTPPPPIKIGKNAWLEQPELVEWEDFCGLLGWYLSEGHSVAQRGRFGISQHKADGVASIHALLSRIGMKFRYRPKVFEVHAAKWAHYFSQFGLCDSKFIPDDVKQSKPPGLTALLTALMDGDGHWVRRGLSGTFYTTSRRLADDFAEIAVKLGFVVYVGNRQKSGEKSRSRFPGRDTPAKPSWEVSIKKVRSGGTEILTGNHKYAVDTHTKRRSDISSQEYGGNVYCIGVEETHNFIIRQRGSVWVSGNSWQFDRYIEPHDRFGKPVMHPTLNRPITDTDKGCIPIIEEVENPFTGETIKTSRIWVPLYMTDNPHAMKDTNYIAVLATMQNEKMKRAYLFGDWKAFRGSYFDNFRKETHTFDPAARHIAGWWKATASLDWGFKHESAAYWHKQDPETRQHLVYKEFCTSRTDPVELGAELARQSQPELRVQGSIVFHVSHDLYADRIGDFTWVELIKKGAEKVIGAGTCYVPDILITKLKEQCRIEGRTWDESMEERILSKPVEGLVFRRAPRSRAVGFMHLRTLMRVEPLFKGDPQKIDWQTAMAILEEGTSEQYSAYLRSFNRDVEILPEMLISTGCARLIDAIPKAQHSDSDPEDVDNTHFVGADQLDSWRYLMAGIRDEHPTPMPKRLEEQRIAEEAKRRNPELTTRDLIWIMRNHAEKEDDGAGEGFIMRRGGRGSVQ